MILNFVLNFAKVKFNGFSYTELPMHERKDLGQKKTMFY